MLKKSTGKSSKHVITAFGQKLTHDDAVDFINEKSKSTDCPVCGNPARTMMLTGPQDESALTIITRNTVVVEGTTTGFSQELNDRSLPVFGLWCGNCGYVQLHTIGTLSTWVANRDTESGEGKEEDENDDA